MAPGHIEDAEVAQEANEPTPSTDEGHARDLPDRDRDRVAIVAAEDPQTTRPVAESHDRPLRDLHRLR